MSTTPDSLVCYENIIGISQTDCECYDVNPYSESKSNLFLDELQGFNLKQIKSLENCEDSDNIWVILNRARQNAIVTCINDITVDLMQKNRIRRRVFAGTVGRRKWTKELTITKAYAGCRWHCADIVSGNLKINSIGTLFNATGTVELFIFNNLNELVAGGITLDTLANKFQDNVLAVPIELPSHSNEVDNLEYFFVYAYDPAMKPLNNDVACNTCGFQYNFDCNNPYFFSQSNKKLGWADYIMIGSWQGDVIDDFDNAPIVTNNYLNGFTFGVEFGCKVHEVICKDTLDFSNSTMALTLAFMVQHKAGELAFTDFLMTDRIDRFTMMGGEAVSAMITYYQQKYAEYRKSIQSQIDVTGTDCFECKDFIEMTRKGIMS